MMMMSSSLLLSLFLFAASGCQAFVLNRSVNPTTTRLSFSPTDYEHTIQALKKTLKDTHEHLKQIEILSARLLEMEQHNPHIGDTNNKQLKDAVSEVKASMEKYGPESKQTQLAFRKVDELQKGSSGEAAGEATAEAGTATRYSEAAIQSHHSFNTIVDNVLIEESMQAIETILAYEHLVKVEAKRLASSENKPPKLDEDSTPGMPWVRVR